MSVNQTFNNAYNIFVISSDKKLIDILATIQEEEILFVQKNFFDLQEIFINVEKKTLDILIIDLDNIKNDLIDNIILNIKNKPKLQQLPLIVLSTDNDIENRIHILNKGFDDFIEKPIILDEFLARINSVLRRCKKFANEKIIITDDIKINVLTRKVEIRGKQIKISAKEFGILKLLAENSNKIFSRQDILNSVWNDQFSAKVNERTIDVHINRLRVALGLNKNGDSYIRTVRGEGYSLHIDDYKEIKDYLDKNYYNIDQAFFGLQNYLNKNHNFYETKMSQKNYANDFEFAN
jgi:two-component system response regulator VicR